MKGSYFVTIFIGCALLAGCSGPLNTLLIPGAGQIELSESSPPVGYDMIGSITGIDGNGCGLFGYKGTYERASINILNNARSIGADYVQITSITEPHLELICFINDYVLCGRAYKRTANAAVPVQRNFPK